MDMNAVIFSIGLLSILVAAVILLFKPYDYGKSPQKFRKIGDHDSNSDDDDTLWRSVRVRPGLIACERIASLQGQLFLSREAPELPLPNCTENSCTCHYVFHDDRRSGLDRRAELAKLRHRVLPDFDRRRSPGRRAGDLLPV